MYLSYLLSGTVYFTERSFQSDWEASSEEESDKPVALPPVTAPRKKGTLKAKLAEKEANKSARNETNGDDLYDSDEVLDPREKLRRDRERELQADMDNAASLMGGAALGGTLSLLFNHAMQLIMIAWKRYFFESVRQHHIVQPTDKGRFCRIIRSNHINHLCTTGIEASLRYFHRTSRASTGDDVT